MQITLRANEVPEHLKEFFEPVGDTGPAPKNLLMIPAMFALAARADGWWLRSAIVWAKGVSFDPDYSGSVMPGSQQDRPTSAYENIFLLAKSPRYYYDNEAVKEAALSTPTGATGIPFGGVKQVGSNGNPTYSGNEYVSSGTRTPRNVWVVNPSPFKGAHFACWPEKLVEPMVKAGTSERGACPQCGKPWERVIESGHYEPEVVAEGVRFVDKSRGDKTRKLNGKSDEWKEYVAGRQTVGFRPACTCPPHEPVPCVVLDPFSGSGTTAKVAVRLGRRAIGVDVSAEYLGDVTAQRFGAGVQMELVG